MNAPRGTMNWTAEQILALAPDAASAKAGQGLAAARKWLKLGADEQPAWGLCQGSGKDPYQTQIDLTEPAFRCACPRCENQANAEAGKKIVAAAAQARRVATREAKARAVLRELKLCFPDLA